ncbi:hypothetical protein FGG08_000725 [Glutinoglossum americanum]|uniref:C2H2-type domain-containing protein n=1 Tax=Glutinoglossum americanum TaxID=1670608 RepID=A0A9P8L0X0_9PEZI|nr:hypothetical protein FGG08_000725 [Glutinoglossum americanum]
MTESSRRSTSAQSHKGVIEAARLSSDIQIVVVGSMSSAGIDIDKLNITTSVGQLSKVAADDKLFLTATHPHPEKSAGIACGFVQFQHCRNFLGRLRDFKRWHKEPGFELEHSDNEVLQEKSIANMEHLLLRYMHELLHNLRILVVLHVAVEVLLRLQQTFGQGWFFEWPNRRRPLSSTWPWNIKPSLVVLWGVCWMFANYETNNFEGEDQAHMQNPALHDFWGFYPGQVSTSPQAQPMESYLNPSPQGEENFNPLAQPTLIVGDPQPANEAMPGSRHQAPLELGDFRAVYNNGGIYMPAAPNVSPSPSRAPPNFRYPDNSGNPATFQGHSPNWPHSLRPSSSSPHVTRQYTYNNTPQIIVQPVQALTPERNRRTRERPSSPQSATSDYSNDLSMRPTSNYPVSPESENSSSGILVDPANSPAMTNSSPSSLVSPTGYRGPSLKRERVVKKNERGHYICDYTSCASEQIAFTRKCEWSKHMDKHDRPYSCSEPGCEKLQGFTYPGGLLRHEREVHKKHGGPKEALYCPHSSCKRSSGQGFTRRENFNEHLRRVHKEGDEKRDESLEGGDNSEAHAEAGRKRKRRSVASLRSDSAPATDETESLREEVKKLRRDNEDMRRENEDMRNRFQRLEEAFRLRPHGC